MDTECNFTVPFFAFHTLLFAGIRWSMIYSYDDLLVYCEKFASRGGRVESIGKSEWGNDIYALFLGRSADRQVLVMGGMHAREAITSLLCVMLCDYYFDAGLSLAFVPMVNPDGNLLVTGKAKGMRGYKEAVILNGGSEDFSLWKANGKGVDLNVNFDAKWGTGKHNVRIPGRENFVGESPFCAKESAVLRDFTYRLYPSSTVSFHAKGREVYWYFGQKGVDKKRDSKIAQAIAKQSGYRLVSSTMGSAGGYKDWCVQKLRLPAFTIEIGADKHLHPLDNSCIIEEWSAVKDILRAVTEKL